MKNVITGLDIGTSKICAAIAEITPDQRCEVRGVGLADAKGVNKGFVSNLDKLIDSITRAVQSAEEKTGIKAHNVITNISGASVSGGLHEGLMPLSRRGREVAKRDIAKVIEMAKHISFSLEKGFLYAAPQEFVVDDNDGIENPLGLFATKLKVKLYVITSLLSHIQNISKAVSYAGYELLDIIPTTVASPSGVLKDEDLQAGAIIVDIGGGITELAVFSGGTLRFFDSVNVGGMDLTAHLSAKLKIPFRHAEEVKIKYGSVSKEDLTKDLKATLDIDNKHIVLDNRKTNKLLKERFDEIFYILKERLEKSRHFKASAPAFVVTGGGALLHGALESLEDFFSSPVRMGRAVDIAGDPSVTSNPVYSAAISLAKYGLRKHATPKPRFSKAPFLLNPFYKLRDIMDEYF